MVAPERKKRFPFSMVKSWNTKTTREMTEKMMERIMKACTALSASVDTGAGEQGCQANQSPTGWTIPPSHEWSALNTIALQIPSSAYDRAPSQ